jgi:hypothetical protein
MSGGGGKSSGTTTTTTSTAAKIPKLNIDLSTAKGVGPTATQQTYTAQGKPAWMTGVWDMPTWGTNAATGKALTQKDLQYQAPKTSKQVAKQTKTKTQIQTPTAQAKAQPTTTQDNFANQG